MANFLRELAAGSIGQDCQDVLTMVHQKADSVAELSDEGLELLKGDLQLTTKHTEESLKMLHEEFAAINAIITSSIGDDSKTMVLLKAYRQKHVIFEKICAGKERLHYLNQRSIEVLDVIRAKVKESAEGGEARGRMYM